MFALRVSISIFTIPIKITIMIVLVLISASFLNQAVANFPQLETALYRDKKYRNAVFGNFKPDRHHQLSVPKIASSLVGDKFDCTFNCISEWSCYSFNIAANPDSNGLFLCELLDTEKFTAAVNALQPNASFHHYSPWVSWNNSVQ